MLLHFKTKRDTNGNTKYLGIDTEKQEFSRQSRGWIDREYPELKTSDYKNMLEQLRRENWQEIDYI
jgi:hypothetical protein